MSQPSPAARLAARLAHLPPDALRALLAEWDRAEARGGGDVVLVIRVRAGHVAVVIQTEYQTARA
jgi:hypothetical protein